MHRLNLFGSRFFVNLFASYAAILLVTSVLVGVLVIDASTTTLRADQEDAMKSACRLLEPFARDALESGEYAPIAARLAATRADTGLRVTLVRADGVVLVDTDQDPERMDNHGERPEILAAALEEFGVSRRFSSTVRFEMLYVARTLRSDDGGVLGVVRVSRALRVVREELARVRDSIILGTAAGFALALVLGLYMGRRFTVPLAEVTRVAEDLRTGDFSSRVRLAKRDEIGILGDTLNRLGEEVTKRIATISEDDAQLRAMLSGMVEGVIAVDEQDRIAFCNDAARTTLGIGSEAVEKRRLWELAPIREIESLLAGAREGSSGRVELEIHRGGHERMLAVHAGPYEGGGKRGVVIVTHDITELRRLERVRRDFVANVSHELKTPLTAIKGFVETLLSGALHDEENNARFLARIDANVERLSHLVSDLLSLARIEAREESLAELDLAWAEVLVEVERRILPVIESKGLSFERDVDPTHVVRAERESMVQILENLLDNAAKYTVEGKITVRTACNGEHCRLDVEDTGIGIPGEDLGRVFERFYRVDKARSREVGGTGLGLSIVRNLVLKLGGEVEVESEVGVGTTFTVVLPSA